MRERLKSLRKREGLTQEQLAAIIGVERSTVGKYEGNQGITPSAEILRALADYFHVSTDYLLGRTNDPTDYEDGDLIASIKPEILENYEGNVRKAWAAQQAIEREATSDSFLHENTVPIPILGSVQAGVLVEAVEDIIGEERIPAAMAALGRHFGLRVKGDSMAPRICAGDVVIVRQQSEVENGDVAVVLVNGEDATIKVFYQSENGVKLVLSNPTYEPLFFSPAEVEGLPVTIIGKVVEMRRKM